MFRAYRKQEVYPKFPSHEWLEAQQRLLEFGNPLGRASRAMKSKLGMHWLRYHPEGRDLDHIAKMQYRSVKLFEWSWNNRDFCRDLLAVLPADAYILARNHPLSEQKSDMFSDPIGTGIRHARDWADKVHSGQCFLPTDRTFFLGINEPDATTGDRNAIDRYTATFLSELRKNGLRGGAFNFSTGHPRTVDGTGNTTADYTVFEQSHRAIVEGHHIAVAHIYGTAALACVPGHYDRLKACQWPDVEWVIGECGIDEHVVGGGQHIGYQGPFAGHLNDYCPWLDTLILGINDARIHSYQVFTYDFSHPWGSFDIRPIRDALESYQWRHMVIIPPPVDVGPTPPVQSGKLILPVQGTRTQRFGENPANYARFNIPGHNGTDYGANANTPVVAVADGTIAYSGVDVDYGFYTRIFHPQFKFHSFYAHLIKAANYPAGIQVKQGQVIGYVGSTGNSSGNHLHFEIRLGTENAYSEGTFGYRNGRVDGETVLYLYGAKA